MPTKRAISAIWLLLISAAPLSAQPAPPSESTSLTYADLADMAIGAPIVAGVVVRRADRLRGDLAVGVPADHVRFLIEADTQTLIRGAEGLPAQVTYLVDMPLDSSNRPPKLRKARLLLLAAPGGRPGELRLIGPHAQLDWTAANEAKLRSILVAANAPDAPPRVTGIGNAFHVPGSLPGESETQIFLTTADGRPVSLGILRRPGEEPRWMVSLAEILDEAAAPPQRDTLLWYRLACFLPRSLPANRLADASPDEAEAIRADYALVLRGLGPCERTLPQP